jgi:beta-lactamase regulating signal transducer with metallopeptidase domain
MRGLGTSPLGTVTWWGQQLLHWLATMNAWTAGLLLGAFLLDKALAERARASWRLALYAPIGLRLLLPLSWRIPLAHAPRVVTLLTPLPRGLLPPSTGAVHAPTFTWSAALVVAYVAVALVIVALRLRAYLSLRRELRSARVASALTVSTNAPCPVLEHEALGPMVVGIIRPRIVLPTFLLSPEHAGALACVLSHESAHVRRGDPWLMAAIQVLTVACWPVLPVWFAARRVRNLVEMACDERALEHADASTRHRYGQALIELAGWRTVKLRPVAAGELHFGSGLRARIDALARVRHWPRVVQAGLVAMAVAGFAACTSVESSEATLRQWIAPTRELRTDEDLVAICGLLLEVLDTSPPHATPLRYRPGAHPDWLPPEMVAYCTSPAVRDFVASRAWLTQARNSLVLIMYDSAATYRTAAASGRYDLCPSGAPMPKVMPAADMPGDVPKWPDDWNDGAGWECLHFGIAEPTWFQYEYVSDGQHATAKARARRTNYRGDVDEVTLSVSEEVSGVGADSFPKIAPNIEETWVRVP